MRAWQEIKCREEGTGMVLLLGMNIIGHFFCNIVSFYRRFFLRLLCFFMPDLFSGLGGCFRFCFPDKNKME